nr:MAG TPA: hypothetical protein [Caudoviricetes sp.]DAR33708.1 MAG TPA: hypothetical protein [Caudoviricetes sp.]
MGLRLFLSDYSISLAVPTVNSEYCIKFILKICVVLHIDCTHSQ